MVEQDATATVTDAAKMRARSLEILIDAAEISLSEYECERTRDWANSVREAIAFLKSTEK